MTCKTKAVLMNNKARKQFSHKDETEPNILFFSNNINFKSLRNCQDRGTADMRENYNTALYEDTIENKIQYSPEQVPATNSSYIKHNRIRDNLLRFVP